MLICPLQAEAFILFRFVSSKKSFYKLFFWMKSKESC